jgi:short-subunit dehydrogenase
MKQRFQNEYIVLSGASSGIGRELCKLLVQTYGANVIGIGRNEEKMLSLQAELGERFSFRLFDVAKKENWQSFAAELRLQGVQPLLIINNAGAFPSFGRVLDLGSETVETVMQVNFFSAVYAVETLAPLLKPDKRRAGIVNVCSSSALCPVVGTAAYSASKSAMKGYTDALRLELAGKARVSILYPGTTATELFRNDGQTKNSALDVVAMKPQKMAKKMARAIYRRKPRAVLGWDAKAMAFLAAIAPVKGLSLIAWVMKKSKSKVFKNVF